MKARRVLGVDFSGAGDAGRRIWIAEGRRASGGALALIDLRPAAALKDGGFAPETAIAALARHVIQEPRTIAGFDFPFSVPKQLIEEPDWPTFVRRFPERFGDCDAFRAWAMGKTGGREIRRPTDRAAATPFNSYNLRIYRQTWWGIAALLHPLVTAKAAVALPYQPLPARATPILIEACPACAMKSLGFYPPYKGREPAHRAAREAVLRRLVRGGFLERPSRALTARILDNAGGDALDAVIAAIATARADLRRKATGDERLEGFIYGRLVP
jgi:hypothetical protein